MVIYVFDNRFRLILLGTHSANTDKMKCTVELRDNAVHMSNAEVEYFRKTKQSKDKLYISLWLPFGE
jgi:hypothetical protein